MPSNGFGPVHGKLVDGKGLYRRESIDGTTSIVGGGFECPCCVVEFACGICLGECKSTFGQKTTGQKEAADKAERERLSGQQQQLACGPFLSLGAATGCHCHPSIHPQFVLPAPTSPPISSPAAAAAAHRVVEEEEERTRFFEGSPRFRRSLEHPSNHPREPLP